MQGWTEDLYFKKRISYSLKRRAFQFDTAELLFSTHEIDLGTQFLLRNMIDQVGQPASILDLGCGYGVIGIVLASFYPEAQVVMADKDLLAVHYTKHNIEINNITNGMALASIGVDHVPPQAFGLIVSNVPGHIGEPAIERDFVLEPLRRLTPGGAYWMVVVVPLGAIITEIARRHELALEEVARRPGHIIYKLNA